MNIAKPCRDIERATRVRASLDDERQGQNHVKVRFQ